MAKKIGKLANRYARALLRSVEGESGVDGLPTPAQKIALELSDFSHFWAKGKELKLCMLSPHFPREQRLKALLEIGNVSGLPEVLVRFLKVVFERDRIGALKEISEAFTSLSDAAAGAMQVRVTTAASLSVEESESIASRFRQHISGEPAFAWEVDPALLGGVVIEYGGIVLDGSVGGRLQRIERNLLR